MAAGTVGTVGGAIGGPGVAQGRLVTGARATEVTMLFVTMGEDGIGGVPPHEAGLALPDEVPVFGVPPGQAPVGAPGVAPHAATPQTGGPEGQRPAKPVLFQTRRGGSPLAPTPQEG